MTNKIRNKKNNTLAICDAMFATPPNPMNPATIAIIKKITAHVNIKITPFNPLLHINPSSVLRTMKSETKFDQFATTS